MSQQSTAAVRSAVEEARARRRAPGEAVAADAERVARACHAMAERFHRGGKLVGFGNGGTTSDAQHVSVEFVHPVLVGKRALPGISLTSDVATITGVANREGFAEVFAHQLRYLAHPDDIALGVSSDGQLRQRAARLPGGPRSGACSPSRWWAVTAARSLPTPRSTTC